MASCVPVHGPAIAENTEEVCANCGKGANDNVKLKNCNACFLVKYCSVDCQKTHRKQHKKACKQRAAELKDEKLYSQGHERPENHFCPICLLAIPFPIDDHAVLYACCMKMVCNGCCHAAMKGGLGQNCPFCRTLPPDTREEAHARTRRRVAARDPEAICLLGNQYFYGLFGLEKDMSRGIELWLDAVDLGSTGAQYKLGIGHFYGVGVNLDKAKGIRYLEAAAIQGDAKSRHILGLLASVDRNVDRAVRHYMISAKIGHKYSLDAIKDMFAGGLATRAQYAEALKGYQDAVEEMKSPDRDEAMASGFHGNMKKIAEGYER